MRVPELQQQFRYESPQVPSARLQGMQVQTNAAMFGADSGRQMEKAGYMLQRGAEQFSHLVDDYNTTKARDAASKMQQGFIEWQSEAQKKQGEAGMNTAADYDTWAKTKREELTKGMSDVQRGRFEGLAGTHMAAQRHWASGYGQQQEQTYKKATWQAEISTAADMLATNIQNPGLAGQAMEQIKDAAFTMGQNMGIGEKATQELMRTSLQNALVPAIHARIQSGDTGTASILMQQYGTNIGGTAMAQLGAELKRERKRAEAEARANAVLKMQDIRDNLQDQELMASQTGNITPLMESAAKLKALGNTRGAAALLKKAEIYGNNHAAIEKVQSLPLPEGLKYIEDIDTRLQDASAKGDTASYSALAHERSVVAKSLQGMVKGLQDDPAKAVSSVVIGDTPARIAESRMTAQAQHGLSLGARRVLTKAEAEKAYTDWQQGDITKKMSVASALQEYGTYAGKAAQEAGIGASEQLAMQNAMADPMNVPHLQTIITASTATSDALPILKDEKTLTASVVEDSKIMKVYTAAARVMQGNASLQGNIRQMEKTMGNLLRMNGGNTDAALKVFDGTMDAVIDSNVTVAFNPKVVASGDIEKGLKEAMQGDLETFLGGRKYRTPYEKTDYLYHLRKSGMWVNAPDGKGYILVDPVSQAPVMREDGHTFRKTNADILHYKDERQPMDPYEVDGMLADTLP